MIIIINGNEYFCYCQHSLKLETIGSFGAFLSSEQIRQPRAPPPWRALQLGY